MAVIKNILCPVDLSESSAQALRYAAALASLLDAGLSVLLVRAGKSRDPDLETFTSDALGPASRQHLIEKDGNPTTEILRTAAAIQADLIVMATHGRTGLQRLLLGSVAEKVVRSSQYPVLTLRPVTGHQVPASRKPETIVCAVDFSLPSKRALEYAAFVTSKSGGRLLVVHALEWSEESESAPRDGVAPLPTSEQDALTQLNDLVTDEVRAKCDPELIVGYGIAADEVLRVAKERQADLVVLGTQGRNAFDLALFGSTAQQVVRVATCPVLMVNGLRPVSVR